MEEHLLFVWGKSANFEGVSDFTFTGPNSAIISDSCDFIGTQI